MRWSFLLAITGCGSSVSAVPEPPDAAVDVDAVVAVDAAADAAAGTLGQGCVLMRHMDEAEWTGAAGEVLDSCGGQNGGTTRGGITTVADGVRGRAGRFTGSGCIDVSDHESLRADTGLTMSAWVFPTAMNGIDAFGVISKREDMSVRSAYNMYLWSGNRAWVDLEGMDDRFAGRAVLANDAWTQITVVFDGGQPKAERGRIYINGAFDVIAPESAVSLPAYTSALHIGCLPSSQTPQNFVGLIDEVAIWERPLTELEISQWYEETRPLEN